NRNAHGLALLQPLSQRDLRAPQVLNVGPDGEPRREGAEGFAVLVWRAAVEADTVAQLPGAHRHPRGAFGSEPPALPSPSPSSALIWAGVSGLFSGSRAGGSISSRSPSVFICSPQARLIVSSMPFL